MSDDFSYGTSPEKADPAGETLAGWLRWWHWLILVALFLAALVWFPCWRFEQRWRQLRIGDSFDQVKQLLGDPGAVVYSVQGQGPGDIQEAHVYRMYWRSYEVLVSKNTGRVVGKNTLDADGIPIISEPAETDAEAR